MSKDIDYLKQNKFNFASIFQQNFVKKNVIFESNSYPRLNID